MLANPHELTVTEATRRGVAELSHASADIRDLALVLARAATDDGTRTRLDDVLDVFGHTRESLAALPDDE